MAEQETTNRVRTSVIGLIGVIWSAVVLAVLTWQLVAYRGIVARLVEWQFARFDTSFPIATLVLIVLVLTSPFWILLLIRLRRARSAPHAKTPASALRRAKIMQRFLAGIAATLGVAALVVALLALIEGTGRDKPLAIGWNQLDKGIVTEGLISLEGRVRLDRIGFFEDRLLFTGRTLWVAPVSRGDTRSGLRLFAEVSERKARPAEDRKLTGVLRRAAIPGELRQLYENAGYSVREPTFVLFRSLASARAPLFSAAGDLALGALIFGVFLLFHRRRLNRLRRKMKEDEEAAAPQTS